MATPDEHTNEPLSTDQLLGQLIAAQEAHRQEIAEMRAELAQAQKPRPVASSTALSPEELLAARMAEVEKHSHYCPGCGALYKYQRECYGRGEAPHPAIEVVSTDELLQGDPGGHTAAPATGR